jgi:hypothetical protein
MKATLLASILSLSFGAALAPASAEGGPGVPVCRSLNNESTFLCSSWVYGVETISISLPLQNGPAEVLLTSSNGAPIYSASPDDLTRELREIAGSWGKISCLKITVDNLLKDQFLELNWVVEEENDEGKPLQMVQCFD